MDTGLSEIAETKFQIFKPRVIVVLKPEPENSKTIDLVEAKTKTTPDWS